MFWMNEFVYLFDHISSGSMLPIHYDLDLFFSLGPASIFPFRCFRLLQNFFLLLPAAVLFAHR